MYSSASATHQKGRKTFSHIKKHEASRKLPALEEPGEREKGAKGRLLPFDTLVQ
ncbi:hypothetical protein SAMN05421736_1252 [Evansella caseinilytica]|uniref:Uncharacterized protein n=1 Tax=Evansella caseinilytica TaxID=1503961 RepID=A0A1H3UT84_9BACI|nr:hypothetical protein SAMN05421736_1252 [Evansella caseinilytica]